MTFVPAVYRERTKSPLNAASWILIVLILSTIFLSFVVSGSLALWPLFIAVPTIILWAFNRARGIYFVEVRSEGLYLNREGPEYAQQASSKCLFRFDDVKKISIVTRWNWFVEPP